MLLRTGCTICFDIEIPTPFIFLLRPRGGEGQWVARETYELEPAVPVREYLDMHGNLCQRLVAPPGTFRVQTSADVRTPDLPLYAPDAPFQPVQDLPEAALPHLLPSRYCESDRMLGLAQEIAADAAPGYGQVLRIEDWVHRTVRFNPYSPDDQLSALEVRERGEGVCRDLAHLGIALCRALTIPARLVAGYLEGLEPMDFHAWFEAYVGGRWYTFDPTQKAPAAGRVVIAVGRDAADVPVFSQFGPAVYPTAWHVSVERLDAGP